MLETIQHKCPKIETPCRKLASKRVPQISDRHKLKNTYFHLVNHDKGGDRDKERHEIVPGIHAYPNGNLCLSRNREVVGKLPKAAKATRNRIKIVDNSVSQQVCKPNAESDPWMWSHAHGQNISLSPDSGPCS